MGIYRGGHHRGYEKGLIKGNSSKGELIIGEIIQGMLSHLVRALTVKKFPPTTQDDHVTTLCNLYMVKKTRNEKKNEKKLRDLVLK